MRAATLKSVLYCHLLLLVAALWAGCVNDPEDREFYYRGWAKPKNTAADKDYFYRNKTQRSGPPEQPRLPSGEEL